MPHPISKLTGFADEASRDLKTQIQATREIGWSNISARMIGGANIHELSEDEFEKAADLLDEAGIKVPEFGSLIGNWGKKISGDFDTTLAEIGRAIPRMKRLGTRIIRIMSYAQEPWGENQHEEERFRRLREITARFAGHGLVATHENCMNWGGLSARHTLRLIEEVPGLKLIFDTGNPLTQKDRSKNEPHPWQDSFEFWEAVRPPVSDDVEAEFTMPGDGEAQVRAILGDALARGYDGYIAIEPHVATVFHAPDPEKVDWRQCYESYVEYGKRFTRLVEGIHS